MINYDCILIPGGGLLPNGSLPPWTLARVERALELKDQTRWIGCLSGGTVHKPPPLKKSGHPVYESRVAAEYLHSGGLNPEKILTEICSFDTIGNAYFSRLLFAEPFEMRRLLILTSEFHLARTKVIFDWIFSLKPVSAPYQINFESLPNLGLSSAALKARQAREKKSLDQVLETSRQITSLAACFSWIYTKHDAYAPGKPDEILTTTELESY